MSKVILDIICSNISARHEYYTEVPTMQVKNLIRTMTIIALSITGSSAVAQNMINNGDFEL